MFADLTTTGYSYLCTEERGLAHFHVMGYLDEVIHLGILANDSRTHHRSVHTGVCSKLYIVLDDHITDLRDLTVDTLCIGLKAKTIGSDYHAAMQDTLLADLAVRIDLHARIEDRTVAYGDIIADIDLRIDLHSCSQTHVLTDIRKSTDIRLFGHLDTFAHKTRLLHAFLGREHRLRYHLQQLSHCSTCVLH